MANTRLTARFRHDWPEGPMQTVEGTPENSHSVLLDWIGGDRVDSGVPPALARAVSSALVRFGPVAFRWTGAPTWGPGEGQVLEAPKGNPLRAAIGRMVGSAPSDLVLTRHASAAAALFEHDWDGQGQAALVLREGQPFRDPARSELAGRRDWRGFKFAAPVLALLTPAVDGDAMVLATGSASDLQRVVDAVAAALADAGIPVGAP